MRDKVFNGFVVAASVAMVLIVYGTFVSDMTIVLASVASGLAASGLGWVGFVRDLRRDAKARQSNIP
jgi:hypothetical protein